MYEKKRGVWLSPRLRFRQADSKNNGLTRRVSSVAMVEMVGVQVEQRPAVACQFIQKPLERLG